jgi:hypothetical protein
MRKFIVAGFISLFTLPAYANCENYTDGSTSDAAPQVTLCYKGKCDDTTQDYVCSSVVGGTSFGYANGLFVGAETGKELQFTNRLGKKMKGWTCKEIDTNSNGGCW